MSKPSRYSPEARERAVRLVCEQAEQHDSPWAAIRSIAAKFGCSAETLQNRVRQAECDAVFSDGTRPAAGSVEAL